MEKKKKKEREMEKKRVKKADEEENNISARLFTSSGIPRSPPGHRNQSEHGIS
jgi:hypothetical protein